MVVQRRATVVELVGLAGAGKSTLARELLADTPTAQLGVPLSRPRSAAAQVRGAMKFVAPYVREARGTPWFTRDQLRGIGSLIAWRSDLNRGALATHPVLWDHGPLFRLAQLDAYGPHVITTKAFRDWWRNTLDDWTRMIDLVVWLDAPDPVLVSRVRSRDQRHQLREADDYSAHQFIERYRASYAEVLTTYCERSAGSVLRLRTDLETPSALALHVQTLLARMDRRAVTGPGAHAQREDSRRNVGGFRGGLGLPVEEVE